MVWFPVKIYKMCVLIHHVLDFSWFLSKKLTCVDVECTVSRTINIIPRCILFDIKPLRVHK
jgi:hypothetical protein